MTAARNTVVFGSSGGTGLACVRAFAAAGHAVSAFTRAASALPDGLTARIIEGDVMDAGAVEAAVRGADIVVVALGYSGRGGPKQHVCADGTANIIAGMKAAGVRRLLVVSSLGVGATRPKAPLLFRLVMDTVLKAQIADKLAQEAAVRASGLDWTIAQPVGLSDKPATGDWLASPDRVRRMQVSRADVAGALLAMAEGGTHIGETVIVSG